MAFNASPVIGTPKEHLYEGKVNGEFTALLPKNGPNGEELVFNQAMVERGQERYNIYCAPCHAESGDGQGVVIKRGMVMPPSFHDDRIMAMTLGQLYHTVTYGARNMKRIPGTDSSERSLGDCHLPASASVLPKRASILELDSSTEPPCSLFST